MGLATGLTLSEVSVAGLLGISESSSYSLGNGSGVCCYRDGETSTFSFLKQHRGSENANIKFNTYVV